ncbi:MAG: hypothetical protein Q8L66_15165 [Caulobacter sp.]|nr:hypothetical protein [Caulobacter sp.]
MDQSVDLGRDDHEAIVDRLHAAALGETSWTATLEHIAGIFGSTAAVLNLRDAADHVLAVEVHSPHTKEFALDYYSSDLMAQDPRSAYLYTASPGGVYFDAMLFDVEAMRRDPRVEAACDALGVTYQLGLNLRLPNDVRATLSVLSTDQEGHASETAITAFRRLAPHIEQACALGLIIEREAATRSALLEALASKADGLILLGRTGAVTFMNDAARAIVEAGDGLALTADGFLTRRLPETRHLQLMIIAALARPGAADAAPVSRMLVTRPSGRHPYVVSVMAAPASERFLSGQVVAGIIHLQDLAVTRLPSREALRAVFGLTDREADFAIELVRCADLTRAAANSVMSVNTARNHLHSILRKTGARGQTDAVQLLGRLP